MSNDMPLERITSENSIDEIIDSLTEHGCEYTLARSPWVDVRGSGDMPDAGIQVAVMRPNGTWDRGEANPIYFDGLPAWYMPEGPIETEGTSWMPIPPHSEGE